MNDDIDRRDGGGRLKRCVLRRFLAYFERRYINNVLKFDVSVQGHRHWVDWGEPYPLSTPLLSEFLPEIDDGSFYWPVVLRGSHQLDLSVHNIKCRIW